MDGETLAFGTGRARILSLAGIALWLALAVILPATARAAGGVYVANSGSADVSQYAIGAGGGLSPLSPAATGAGQGPTGVAVTPDGKTVYVANQGDKTVSQYDVDPLTGKLTSKTPGTVAAGTSAYRLAVSPDGKSAYVTNAGDNNVSQYDIDPLTGKLSPKTPATVAAGISPTSVAISPDGKNAYVTNESGASNSVSQYDIDPLAGTLSPKGPPTVAAGQGPSGVAVTPDSKSAYVTNYADNNLRQYDIDPLTGNLTSKSPATVATGSNPQAVTVSPDGKSAYVPNYVSNDVSQYDVDPPTGKLTPKSPGTAAAGANPRGVAVTADGASAYVTNYAQSNSGASTVSQYDIDPLTGGLSSKIPATVGAGTHPWGLAVGPLPLAAPPQPQASSLTLAPKSAANPVGSEHTVVATVEDASGAPVSGVTVRFSVSGANTASGSQTTDANGQASFAYTGAAQGVDTISAFADNDANGVQDAGDPGDTASKVWFTKLAGGSFAIGDRNAAVGNRVTFWSAQWPTFNTLSGGPAPSAFKGFLASAANPPTCGSNATTPTASSSNPPATVPQFMAVMAPSSISKAGSTISADAPVVAVLKTDLGYAPSAGHPGTGTVVANACGG